MIACRLIDREWHGRSGWLKGDLFIRDHGDLPEPPSCAYMARSPPGQMIGIRKDSPSSNTLTNCCLPHLRYEGLLMRHRIAVAASCMTLVCACSAAPTNDAQPPSNMDSPPAANYALRLKTPETSFRLTQEERASIDTRFDVNALERLLGMMQPSERHYVLSAFQVRPDGHQRQLTYIGDAVLQEALGQVWRPVLDSLPRAALMNDPALAHFPGIREARARVLRVEANKAP